MKQPEIIAVTLANGDVALFVNGDAVIQLDAGDSGTNPAETGEYLAKALGVEMQQVSMEVPSDEDWSWNDVYELLPPPNAVTDEAKSVVPVAYWDSQVYSDAMGDPANGKPYLMEITDHRESSGQLYVDVASEEGELDDILSATFEINRLPGSKDDTQCLHLHFDGDNLAASFFKQGDKYIIRPETDVIIRGTVLPNGERGWVLE
jgi:hypothetical protein